MATAAELKARLAKYAVKKEQENATPKTPEVAASAIPEPAVRTEVVSSDNPSDKSSTALEVVVRTDVQSTDVVIVERPAGDDEHVGARGTDGSSDKHATDLDVTNPIHQGFLQRLADLETALLARDPLMKTHLGAIHKTMIEYEEIANLLRPEEIAKIMTAQQTHTGIVLRAETLGKSKAATNKKAAQLGLGDL